MYRPLPSSRPGQAGGRSSLARATSTSMISGPPPDSRRMAAGGGSLARYTSGFTPPAAARQPALAGNGAAAIGELAGADHWHRYPLRAAARQPAWAGWGAAAGGELAVVDHLHLYALRTAARQSVLAGSHSHLTTPHPPTCTLTQALALIRSPIPAGPHPRFRRARLHTSPHPLATLQQSPIPHTSIHGQWQPQPRLGTHLQPCWAVSDIPAALARPPPLFTSPTLPACSETGISCSPAFLVHITSRC
jgi:hypothetical protein